MGHEEEAQGVREGCEGVHSRDCAGEVDNHFGTLLAESLVPEEGG